MDIQIPLEDAPEAVAAEVRSSHAIRPATVWTIAFFILFWIGFYALDQGLPYLTNGSDVVFRAKVHLEEHGQIFPADPATSRVMIFGDSKVLAGFLPSEFDRMAAGRGLKISSFNSGFPGTDVFLPELKAIAHNGQAPNVLLLTLPWTDPPRDSFFHLVRNDHKVIHALFPFRFWLRDATSFLMNSPRYGGIAAGYREARHNGRLVEIDRGYYMILEQSRFPGGRLPASFHLPSDNPAKTAARSAPAHSPQIRELDGLIRRYHMRCFYLPQYYRLGEFAPAPAKNPVFAAVVERDTPCRVLGPDYFLYPNRDFSDQTHVNRQGARLYTADLFHLLAGKLGPARGEQRAIQ